MKKKIYAGVYGASPFTRICSKLAPLFADNGSYDGYSPKDRSNVLSDAMDAVLEISTLLDALMESGVFALDDQKYWLARMMADRVNSILAYDYIVGGIGNE